MVALKWYDREVVELTINGLKISYLDVGKGKTILLLHGWAVFLNKEHYLPLIDLIKKNFRVVAVDFPGFGESDQPAEVWGVSDFAQLIHHFIIKKDLKVEAVVGHSFGGRVAVKMAALYEDDFKKLVLVDSAGIERKSLQVTVLLWLGKHLPSGIKMMGRWLRSKDYVESNGIMRKILNKVVLEDQEEEMKKIAKKTLLIWGEEDHTTPLWQGQIIHKAIRGSDLKIIGGGNHGLPYKKPETVAPLVTTFVQL